jgi:hypothetical protein
MNFDLIDAFKFERLYHGGGKTNGEAVAPFGDLHVISLDIPIAAMYIQ